MVVHDLSLKLQVFQRHRRKQHKQMNVCLIFLFGKHRDPQSINTKPSCPEYQSALLCTLSRFSGTTFVETAVFFKWAPHCHHFEV